MADFESCAAKQMAGSFGSHNRRQLIDTLHHQAEHDSRLSLGGEAVAQVSCFLRLLNVGAVARSSLRPGELASRPIPLDSHRVS
jgi:hypothetical protein